MTHEELLHTISAEYAHNKAIQSLYEVVELHKPNGFGCAANCIETDTDGYAWKNTAYPCPTIQVIEKELQ